MIVETRQIVPVEEIRSIELKCAKRNCGGVLCIDLRPGCIDTEEQCPRCKRTWWTPSQPSTVLELLEALMNNRQRLNKGADTPIVAMILPGPTESAK